MVCHDINAAFARAIGATKTARPIVAHFKDGGAVVYTYDIFALLASDEDVWCITDGETGEWLFPLDD